MRKITPHKPSVKHLETFRVQHQVTDESVFKFLSAINSPRSLTVWLLYQSNDTESHDQLTALECHPYHYDDGLKFRDDYAATKFLSKASFLKTSFDKKKVALEKFQKYEELCRATNNRFRNLSLDPLFQGSNVWLLNATIRKIEEILGDFNGDELFDSANWGPGVTTVLKGSRVSAINKFHLENGITRALYALIGPLFEVAYPLWWSHLTHLRGSVESSEVFDFQRGNVLVTVPKDSKADRVIAVEPGLNLWFQKAVGAMIRRRLQRFESINLDTQWRVNQLMSKWSSKDSTLATVDFSSASDSISLEVVRALIPPRWFLLMDSCRSKFCVDGTEARWWEKFSSMGNGFTFELETLIFYAAAHAVTEYEGQLASISVFGDDVLLPRTSYPLFVSFTEFLGFRVNLQKSFSEGYFRESCGSHFWDGIDVKPIFLKERISNVEAIFKLANSIRLLGHRRNSHYGCDHRFLHVWRSLVGRIPKLFRLRVPAALGDVGLISNFDEACAPRAGHGTEGYVVLTLQQVGLTDSLDSPAVLMARLWKASMLMHRNTYALRGKTKRKVVSTLVPQWYNLGPWI